MKMGARFCFRGLRFLLDVSNVFNCSISTQSTVQSTYRTLSLVIVVVFCHGPGSSFSVREEPEQDVWMKWIAAIMDRTLVHAIFVPIHYTSVHQRVSTHTQRMFC